MKKTLFMMMTAALVSGQAFGYEPTGLEGIQYTEGHYYAGVSDKSGTGTTGGNVLIKADNSGSDCSEIQVYGAYTKSNDANNNTVTMTGGEVYLVGGAYTYDSSYDTVGFTASNNTVIMTGGTARWVVLGAFVNGPSGEAMNNKVILVSSAAGTNAGTVYGAESVGGKLHDNQVHLIGDGGSATIAGQAYAGQGTLTLGRVYGSKNEMNSRDVGSGNSVDIYGHGIEAKSMELVNLLNFHIVNTDETILTLTDETVQLELETVSLSFDFSEPVAMDTELTLVKSAGGITMSASQLDKTWAVMSDTGLQTAKLSLSNDKKTLKLTVTPEPATATLSLLALAGLCARRRRH